MTTSLRGFAPTTIEELIALPDPRRLGPKHRPTRHDAFATALIAGVEKSGLKVEDTRLLVKEATPSRVRNFKGRNRVGLEQGTLMGEIILTNESPFTITGALPKLGFRHGNDQVRPHSVVAGQHILVCANGCYWYDEEPLHAKHSLNFDLEQSVADALENALGDWYKLNELVGKLENAELTDLRAKSLIYEALVEREVPVLATQYIGDIHNAYFNAEEEGWIDCQPRNFWGLHNAFTRAAREAAPIPRRDAEQATTQFFSEKVK